MQKPASPGADPGASAEASKRIGDLIRKRGSVLDLSNLGLSQLPERFSKIPKLTELDLSGNRFTGLPLELLGHDALTRLNLSGNPLRELSPEIGKLGGLTRLDINHTSLSSLPAEIGMLARLARLYLEDNQLVSLPDEVSNLANLSRLYLAGNSIDALPKCLAGLEKLTRLDLSRNRLSEVSVEIGRLLYLTVLELSHNPIVSIAAEIGLLEKLTVLHLSHTKLNELPPEIGNLANLTELDLRSNPLAMLPESLRNAARLERLYLHDNPSLRISPALLGPDPRIADGKKAVEPASILDYYFGREEGTTRSLDEVKMVFSGSCGSGKTTIIQALRDQPFREHESSTPGAAFYEWTIEGSGGKAVSAQVWELSGQPASHLLHPCFMGPKCLHVLVLTGGGHSDMEDAAYWLTMIRDANHELPSVIIALNQWNTPGKRAEVDRNSLRGRFPFIRGFVEMDCRGKKGIQAFKAVLFKELERMPWVREPFPQAWDAVRCEMENLQHLSITSYREICAEHGVIDEGQQDYLLEMLQQLGTVVRFGTVIFKAPWFATRAYPLLQRAEKQQGFLSDQDVSIIPSHESDGSLHKQIMSALDFIGIAREGQSRDGSFWMIPVFQPDMPPNMISSFAAEADIIRQEYTCKSPPIKIVLQMSLRRWDFIETSNEWKQQWRDGIILIRKGAKALIHAEPSKSSIAAIVSGPSKVRNQLSDLCLAEFAELDDDRSNRISTAGDPVTSSDSAR